ncbi:hypothetical protein HMP0015_2732 [Acinetobacter haemolyticus ATCC 19194]|uniref:Uncharacterized protein n=1 Tax=Acinetobacter haemolyticus ATCC 19194 TaxID=707232 RepID=D4XSP0_ACIHA|nr:hypothetical protein HMP0015_2732 [Acinetobacter haemolyticus ATCC 19194]
MIIPSNGVRGFKEKTIFFIFRFLAEALCFLYSKNKEVVWVTTFFYKH